MNTYQLAEKEVRRAHRVKSFQKILGMLIVTSMLGLFYGFAYQAFLYTFASIILMSLFCFGATVFAFLNGLQGERLVDMKGKAWFVGFCFLVLFVICMYFLPGYIKDYPIYMNGEYHKAEGVPSEVDFGKDGSISTVTLNGRVHQVGKVSAPIHKQYRNYYFVIYYLPNSNFTIDQEIHGIIGNNRMGQGDSSLVPGGNFGLRDLSPQPIWGM